MYVHIPYACSANKIVEQRNFAKRVFMLDHFLIHNTRCVHVFVALCTGAKMPPIHSINSTIKKSSKICSTAWQGSNKSWEFIALWVGTDHSTEHKVQ